MTTTDEDRVLEVLDDDECLRLLEKSSIGRLGYTDGALPAILPVSYAVNDGYVLVASRRGSPMTRALRGSVVAFEVDACSGEDRTGWSVTVVGPSRVISKADEVQRLEALQLTNRPPSPDRCFVAVRIDLLRGWRMTPPTDPDPSAARGPESA
jgi:nitroimidazol reductase NimA-like FMN-containing flavoprotein (pyridoxamine 5'-phosphate oxidase superfamily)